MSKRKDDEYSSESEMEESNSSDTSDEESRDSNYGYYQSDLDDNGEMMEIDSDDSAFESDGPMMMNGRFLSDDASFIAQGYYAIGSNNRENNPESDDSENDYYKKKDRWESQEYDAQERRDFIFNNRNEPGMSEFLMHLKQEDPDLDFTDNLEDMIDDLSDGGAKEKAEEIDDDELFELSKESAEKLGRVDDWLSLQVDQYCQNIRYPDDYEDAKIGELEDLEDDYQERISKTYLELIENNDDPQNVEDYLSFLQESELYADENSLEYAVDFIIQKIKEEQDYHDELLEFIENIVSRSARSEEFLEKKLEELTLILLDNNNSQGALNSYEILRTIDEDKFISDIRLADALSDVGSFFESIKHADKVFEIQNSKDKDSKKLKKSSILSEAVDDTTDALLHKRRKEEYDLNKSLKKVKEDERNVFLVEAISLSLLFSQEVNERYYDNQKQKLGRNKHSDDRLIKHWISIIIKETLLEFDMLDSIKDEVIESVRNDLFKIIPDLLKLRKLEMMSQEKRADTHNYKTKEHTKVQQIADAKLAEAIIPLISNDNKKRSYDKKLQKSFSKKIKTNLAKNSYKEVYLERGTLKTGNPHLEQDDELDLFANLRLLRRNAIRSKHNKAKTRIFNRGKKKGYSITLENEDLSHQVELQQEGTSKDGIEYFIPELGSYNKVQTDYISVLNKLNIDDKDIAKLIRSALKGEKFFDEFNKINNKLEQDLEENLEEIFELICDLSTLIFCVESSRNDSSLIIHQMMLDLIIDGKMTFKEAFVDEKMPMSKKSKSGENGAVNFARSKNYHFRQHLPIEIPHYGPFVKKNDNFDNNLVMQRENELISHWIRHIAKKKVHDVSDNEFCNILHRHLKEWYPEIEIENLISHPKKGHEEQASKAKKSRKRQRREDPRLNAIERISGGAFYADDELNYTISANIPANTALIESSISISAMSGNLNQALSDFGDNLDQKQLVMPVHIYGNHFTALHVSRNDDNSFNASYIDPYGNGRIPKYISDALKNMIGVQEDEIIISQTRLQSGNVHCGAFTSFLLRNIANSNMRVNENGNLQLNNEAGNWQNVPDLSVRNSNNLGLAIRENHRQMLTGQDINSHPLNLLENLMDNDIDEKKEEKKEAKAKKKPKEKMKPRGKATKLKGKEKEGRE